MSRILPSPAYLRQRLRYDPETGKLYWRAHPDMPNWWNTRRAETEALASLNTTGYRQGSMGGVDMCAHNVVWAMEHGVWTELDHLDHDKRNNRLGNLVPADDTSNARNRPMQRNNSSGVVGVHWNARQSRWVVQIGTGKGQTYLGVFRALDEAIAVRKAAEIAYDFHPNHGKK